DLSGKDDGPNRVPTSAHAAPRSMIEAAEISRTERAPQPAMASRSSRSRICEAPRIRSTDADGARSERESLVHVRSAANASVHQHRNTPRRAAHDLRQRFERRAATLECATTVVGN